ncbi:MAG: glycosyltransferase family 2 protein [Prosthecobacter sp.]|uniref:glycosyltransferase family 2 protein n=1 Tax=Prosthecobacter sp. TaxID=1965333 RepID=UPI0038FF6603
MALAPVTVGIPTYNRNERVINGLAHIFACNPVPAEIIVHIDASDGLLEQKIAEIYPSVHVLASSVRIGPGGGRHRCLQAATQPYFASFDDDSWPVDADFFGRLVEHLELAPRTGGVAASIFLRGESPPPLTSEVRPVVDYVGCGHALKVAAYRELQGYVDRPIAYGLEERDLALQLHAAGWELLLCGDLRVFHDTDLAQQKRPEITAATVANAALLVWLRYPFSCWPYGLLQYLNVIGFMLSRGRLLGVVWGLLRTPLELWRFRQLRRPISATALHSYLRQRRLTVPSGVTA